MKKSMKVFCLTSLLVAGSLVGSSYAQGDLGVTLDQLDISQLNPKLVPAFNVPGTIILIYNEQYVVDKPQVCSGPSFHQRCSVFLSHLTKDPGVTLKVNQQVQGNALVTTIVAHPDGKRFVLNYQQTGQGTALNVTSIKRMDNM